MFTRGDKKVPTGSKRKRDLLEYSLRTRTFVRTVHRRSKLHSCHFFQKNFLRRCCSSFSPNACLEKSNKIISLFLQKEILWNRKTVFCQENCDKAKQTVRVLAMSKKSGTRQSILRMFRFFIKNETTLRWISFFVKFSFAAFHDALLGQKLFLFLLSFNFEGILSYTPFFYTKNLFFNSMKKCRLRGIFYAYFLLKTITLLS